MRGLSVDPGRCAHIPEGDQSPRRSGSPNRPAMLTPGGSSARRFSFLNRSQVYSPHQRSSTAPITPTETASIASGTGAEYFSARVKANPMREGSYPPRGAPRRMASTPKGVSVGSLAGSSDSGQVSSLTGFVSRARSTVTRKQSGDSKGDERSAWGGMFRRGVGSRHKRGSETGGSELDRAIASSSAGGTPGSSAGASDLGALTPRHDLPDEGESHYRVRYEDEQEQWTGRSTDGDDDRLDFSEDDGSVGRMLGAGGIGQRGALGPYAPQHYVGAYPDSRSGSGMVAGVEEDDDDNYGEELVTSMRSLSMHPASLQSANMQPVQGSMHTPVFYPSSESLGASSLRPSEYSRRQTTSPLQRSFSPDSLDPHGSFSESIAEDRESDYDDDDDDDDDEGGVELVTARQRRSTLRNNQGASADPTTPVASEDGRRLVRE